MDSDSIGSVIEARLEVAEMLLGWFVHDLGHRLHGMQREIAQITRDPSVRANRRCLQHFERIQDFLRDTDAEMRRQTAFLLRPAQRHPDSCDDPASVIERTIEFLQPMLKRRSCHVRLEANATGSSIRISEPSFREIITSLLLNSIQAHAKTVLISVNHRDNFEIWTDDLAMDDVIVINVRDDGHGILLEPQNSVFDPQTTTRSDEHATGLGLFISRALARRSGGELMIAVDEADSSGASFSLVLPAGDDT